MKKLICFCAVILMAAGAAFAKMGGDMDSCPMMGGDKCDMGKMGPGMKGMKESAGVEKYLGLKAELGLTDAQVTQLETIKTDEQKARIKRQSDIKIAEVDLRELKKKQPVDFNAVREKTKQISALRSDGELAAIDAKEKAYNVLTADQKAKLPDAMKAKKHNMKEDMKDMKKK